MNKEELLNIIQNGEGLRLEFKSSFNNTVIESLIAFSNASGGKILLGIDDNGNVKGVTIGKESEQKWINEIKIKTEYKIVPDLQVIEINKKKVVILSVSEYPSKPISYKGKYYKRFNASNHIMSTDEVVNEYLLVINRSWDMFPVEGYSIEHLSFEKVIKIINRINDKRENKIEEDPLLFLKKYGLVQGINITNAALLLFAKDDLNMTEIRIGLFETETVIKKSITLKGDLFSEVESVIDFIMSHITKEYIIIGTPEREERWQYPLPAIREFVINAIIHRDYRRGIHSQFKVFKDRIELWNIGKLPEELTIEDIYKGNEKSIPRNIKVAEIFKEAFLIEKYGSGIKRSVSEIESYGLPRPSITEIAGGINILIFGNKETVEETVEILIKKINENAKITVKELIKETKLSRRGIEWNIKKLKKQGKLKRIGSTKGGYWKII